MEAKIVFRIDQKQKNKLQKEANLKGLLLGSFCRMILVRELKNANR